MIRARRNTLRVVALSVCVGLWGGAASAQDAVNSSADNVAISGYDAVAYHTEARARPGDPAHTHEWHDAIWQFATAENRALFAAEPERYAPHYGGFCAGGMSLGRRSPVDPDQWVIIEGNLYLGGSSRAIEIVTADPRGAIAAADANWKTLGLTD